MKTAVLMALVAAVAAAPAPSAEPGWDKWRKPDDHKTSSNNEGLTIGVGYNWKQNPGKDDDYDQKQSPFSFTSTYHVVATPDQVFNGTAPGPVVATPGQPGAVGYFNYGINSDLGVICYNITIVGVTGDYRSPARTATHIHQAGRGQNGPPRLAFPNPVARNDSSGQVERWNGQEVRRSVGCLTAPFVTGVNVSGSNPPVDTGSASGFTLKQIEDNPAGFFTDVHTAQFVPGAVRGQLA